MTIRFAKEKDVLTMLAIYTPYVENTNVSFEYAAPSADEFAGRLEEFVRQGMPWLVAEEHGKILGYAYAHRYGVRRAFDWTAEASVYLDESVRGHGVGRALYTALCALLTAQGYRTLYALITSENEPSRAFHRAMGFTPAADFDHLGYKHGRWLGVAYMRRQLAEYEEIMTKAPCAVTELGERQVREILQKAENICKQKD